MEENYKIILFDGVCNLCNGAINFVIKRDQKNIFKFAALQSDIGKNLLRDYKIDSSKIDSIILIDGSNYYLKSSAALGIAKHLSGGFSLLAGFLVLPVFLRDLVYDFIAKNRYKWFGRKDSCMVPTLALKKKFL